MEAEEGKLQQMKMSCLSCFPFLYLVTSLFLYCISIHKFIYLL